METLQDRKARRQKLQNRVDAAYHSAMADDVSVDISLDDSAYENHNVATGCFAAIGRSARRLTMCTRRKLQRGRAQAAAGAGAVDGAAAAKEAGVSSAGSVATESKQSLSVSGHSAQSSQLAGLRSQSMLSQALFGVKRGARTAATPAERLQVAHASIASRTSEVEQRAADTRVQAKLAMQGGNKQLAMRLLKRSKQLEHQASNLSNAAAAVERQSDMLEEASLQQEVAQALKAGVKDIKQVQLAMKTVESVTDTAHEMADDVDEIHQLLAQLGEHTAAVVDDDDLQSELESMMAEETTELSSGVAGDANGVARNAAAAPLSNASSEGASSEAFPSVPSNDSAQALDSMTRAEAHGSNAFSERAALLASQ